MLHREAIGAPVASSLARPAVSRFRSGVVDSAHRRPITRSKAQPQEPRPRFPGAWAKDRDPPYLRKGPRDPDAGHGLLGRGQQQLVCEPIAVLECLKLKDPAHRYLSSGMAVLRGGRPVQGAWVGS